MSKRSDILNWGQIVQNWHIIVRIKYNDYIYYLYLVGTGVPETFLELGKIQKYFFENQNVKNKILKKNKQYITPGSF